MGTRSAFLVVSILWLAIAGTLWILSPTVIFLGLSWSWGGVSVLLYATYVVLSLKVVGPDSIGCLLFFGKPIKDVGSGLCLVPFFLFRVVTEKKTILQQEIPGEPENIWRGQGQPPEGKVPPLFITTSDEHDGTDALDRRMVLEPVVINRFRIESLLKFIGTIESREDAERQMADLVVSFLTTELAKRTPKKILTELGSLNVQLQTEMKKLVSAWGVKSEGTEVKLVEIPKTVSEALRDVPASKLRKEVTETNAAAEKKKRILEGEGAAEAAQRLIEARGFGAKKSAEEMGLPTDAVFAAEVARDTIGRQGDKVVILGTDGLTNALSMGAAFAKALGGKKPEGGGAA